MNTTLDALLAEQACRDLVLAAADAVDGRDFLAFADLFEVRGVLVRPDGTELVGRPAIVAAYAARDPERLTRHLVSNLRVRLDLALGTALATCTVLLWSGRHSDAATQRGRPADPQQQVGEFRDLLVKTSEGWRIRRREAGFTLFRS
ncbi:nuclear transport factor 2 family protein [Hydrogenophaga atypica]|uniref:Nuclear transport factor 2 family protein n=1 Tax=Hydrogenophaga atypica TaxID=249409 RepID=A0ABW2QKB3_9BURK